jgi:uncharacterized protein YbaA (DUF1428 family)
MAQYVDGFVVPVPKKAVNAYKKLARLASKVWMEHGALAYVECLADDAPVGKRTSFPRAVKLKDGETLVFAYIVYRSRKDRDRINELAMNDKRFAKQDWKSMPFDGKRMVYGGFKSFIVR